MPEAQVTGSGLPFAEAIDFFRTKANVSTRRWNDIWQQAHARAFMIAGAQKAGLLSDFRLAVDKAVAGGSYQNFQRDFDAIVKRHGWSYNGGRGWRTSVIYRTNMRSAYQTGRYKQMTDPDVLKYRPYWQYQHGDSKHPRPEHLAWDGLVLPANDPWWQTHYPSNGWGCSCSVRAISKRQLKAMGKTAPDKAPIQDLQPWEDPATGEVHQVPRGIDPGFAYNIGEAAYGRPVAEKVIALQAGGKWKHTGGKSPADYGRDDVPLDKPQAALGLRAKSEGDLEGLFTKAMGGEAIQLTDAAGDKILLDKAIVSHIAAGRIDGRERFFPLIKEVVEQPFEIWASFAQNELTGRYGLRRNYVKFFDLGGKAADNRVVGLVAEVVDGVWTGVTVFRGKKSALKNLRRGVLVYGRE